MLFGKDESDNRLRMFSTPIILYLACKSNTIISEEDTIGKFYDKVFRQIAERKHTEYHIASGVYDDVEKEWLIKALNWQYTKELAYQMFLNDTLILTNSDENNKDHIQYAKKRTFSILHERGENIPDDMEIDSQLYLAVSHFASGNEKGIEFVHKTVYEYFTAVKLYEDYFSKFNSEYFEKNNNLQTTDVWNNIIEAFRYSSIPKEIFNYLNEMNLPAYIESKENSGFDYQGFEKCTIESLNKHILSDMDISKSLTEYKTNNDPINIQIERAFRNLTWFLSGHGFNNNNNNNNNDDNMWISIEIRKLLSQYTSNVNFQNWILNEVDLTGANLNYAILSEAHLESADLERVDLEGANLHKAYLENTNFYGANLKKANLKNAHLREAYLSGANLIGAKLKNAILLKANLFAADFEETDLRGADLRAEHLTQAYLGKAIYCLDADCLTIFPKGFDPKSRGMIEVDANGNLINES